MLDKTSASPVYSSHYHKQTIDRKLISQFLNIFIEDGLVQYGSGKYYALCGIGGMLACGVTHTGMVPLDLVKCRIQVRQLFNITLQLMQTIADLDAIGKYVRNVRTCHFP